MSFTIAVAGKGGTGKTTISGFIIKYLNEKFKTPILAVDADPNMNLNEVLGVKVENTIGSIRESSRDENKSLPGGISKIEYLELMINQALIEGAKVDLLVMGRPEGTGCYCAANHLIRNAIDKLANKYKFIIIDNEAGMEHLSRHTTKNVDLLIIVADTSWRGLNAGFRIKELALELSLNIKRQVLIINRVKENPGNDTYDAIKKHNLSLLGLLPEDEKISEYDRNGIPLKEINKDNNFVRSLYSLMDSLQLKME